jgi:O-methyltransferase
VLEQLKRYLVAEHAYTVTAERLDIIGREIEQIVSSRVSGAVVELGCYKGAMSVWMRAQLDKLGDQREIHVFDSFQGLPAPTHHDLDYLAEGEVAAPVTDLLDLHDRWKLRRPIVHCGWFSETLAAEMPHAVAFGYLDGDFYESILTSLENCVPRLVPGGVLIIDDYADLNINPRAWSKLPGVKSACDAFFGESLVEVIIGESDLAFGAYRKAGGRG